MPHNITSNLPMLHLLRERPALRGFIIIRAADELASQMLNVAVGWYVYTATHNPMSLAYVGLAQFLPSIGMLPIAGQAADRFDRRKLIGLSLLLQTLCVAAFGLWSAANAPSALPVYLLLLVMGSARAFYSPAMSALLPHVVNGGEFPRALPVLRSSRFARLLARPSGASFMQSAERPCSSLLPHFTSLP